MRARLRDEALRLFAEHGPDAVSVRQIAAAAGASPALVVHHFGSKQGLRDAVDEHVVALFEALLAEVATGEHAGELLAPPAAGATSTPTSAPTSAPAPAPASAPASVGELLAAHLPPDSPVPAYLRRLLLTDSEAGRAVFRRLYELSRATLSALVAAGLADPGRDPAVRAAFLLANDLAVLLLRDRIADVLGLDPLSAEGMDRWAGELLTVYGGGLTAPPPEERR
ncbi:TetR family transcriptional regulator [Actinomadura gamaensis]|uniref:TetR family transcriptional regulator n=1 Tax=Actinomadura gamaensis TaxID=1763541 RepID=A0ABV9U1C9_9ACTN